MHFYIFHHLNYFALALSNPTRVYLPCQKILSSYHCPVRHAQNCCYRCTHLNSRHECHIQRSLPERVDTSDNDQVVVYYAKFIDDKIRIWQVGDLSTITVLLLTIAGGSKDISTTLYRSWQNYGVFIFLLCSRLKYRNLVS